MTARSSAWAPQPRDAAAPRLRTVAVAPLSAPLLAKSRLAGALSPAERVALARWMAERVIRALQASGVIAEVAVVSPDQATLAWAQTLGVTPILQADGADMDADQRLNQGLALGRAWAQAQEADALLITLGDLPLLTPTEVAQFVALAGGVRRDALGPGAAGATLDELYEGTIACDEASATRRVRCAPRPRVSPIVALAPDRAERGTNALLARPPALAPLAFGVGSFTRHQALAQRAGVEPLIFHAPGLAFDVDTPPDLAELRASGLWAPPAQPTPANGYPTTTTGEPLAGG